MTGRRGRRAALVVVCALSLLSAATARAGSPPPALESFAVDDSPVRPGMRTICMGSDSPEMRAKVCFDVYPDRREADPKRDYFYWRFLGRGRATENHRLERIKVKINSQVGRAFDWDPGEDAPVTDTAPIGVVLADDQRVTPDGSSLAHVASGQRFRALPGLVHSRVGDSYFHVSWLAAPGKGLPCCEATEVGGGAMWGIPQGGAPPTSMSATLTLTVETR